MPMTVAELKEVVNVDITGVTIDDLNEFTITFIDSGGIEYNVDDCGTYDIINSTLCGDDMNSYFVFVAKGLGSNELTYGHLKIVLDESDDADLAYFLLQLQTLPASSGTVKAVEGARLEITRLTSVNEGGELTSSGVLTLSEIPLPCSSSSSSSSS